MIGSTFEKTVDYINENFSFILNSISSIIDGSYHLFLFIYTVFNPLIYIFILAILPLYKKKYKLSAFIFFGLCYILSLNLWYETMQTLSIISVAVLIAILVGIPLGILGSKSKNADAILKPILDFMQTMPAFVYLLPAVVFFGVGTASGVIATIIYALPPVIRLTTLGISEVPDEIIESADSFGATSMQKLLTVQIPSAIKTIMTGVNQTIMMSLSMVVIAALIGAEGLGNIVYVSVSQLDLATAFESGLAIVFLAITLDRLSDLYNTKTKNVQKKNFKNLTFLITALLLLGTTLAFYQTNETTTTEIINVATNDSWSDHVAVTALFEYIIETETNYEFETQSLDVGYIYESLSTGDNDIYFAAWLPNTQSDYLKLYQDEVVYISTVYDQAKIGLVIPTYMGYDSINDLIGNEAEFNNAIYGIEPGSGTAQSTNETIEAYNLDVNQITSSTSSMLQELDSAYNNNEPIVITGWKPHWMFDSYDLTMLDDPLNSYNGSEEIQVYSRVGFADDYPDLIPIITAVSLNDEEMSSLLADFEGATKEEYDGICASLLEQYPEIYSFE